MKNYKGHFSSDKALYYTVDIFLLTVLVIVAYPLAYIISASFSSASAILSGRVWLWPVDFTLNGYKFMFKNSDIMLGYRNSFIYMIGGTTLSVIMVILAAYPLSRKDFKIRNLISLYFTFTMFFSGGLVPSYLLIRNLHMYDTPWVMIIPGSLSVWNVIITRTYFQSNVPNELLESAKIDGCSDFRFLLSIVLPISKAIIACNILWSSLGYWNSYFSALIYLSSRNLMPLQVVLREILILSTIDTKNIPTDELISKIEMQQLIKYSSILVASLPMFILYPFVQKYFVKGIMLGSLKG